MSFVSVVSFNDVTIPAFCFCSRVAFVVWNKSTASRFASISDEEVKEFTEKLENENTKKKTLYDIKVFKEYLDDSDEKREIEDITPVELQSLQSFVVKLDYFETQ